jgi:hypothetical protein
MVQNLKSIFFFSKKIQNYVQVEDWKQNLFQKALLSLRQILFPNLIANKI